MAARKTKAPAFQCYPRDFLVDTMGMSNEELGAYTRLLMHAWDPPPTADGAKPEPGHLPNDPDILARKSEARERWPEVSGAVLRLFRKSEDGTLLIQKRMVEERKKQRAYSKSMSGNGKKGGRPRKEAPAASNPEESPDEATKKPRLFSREPEKTSASASASASSAAAQEQPPVAPQGGAVQAGSRKRSEVPANLRAPAERVLAVLNEARLRVVPGARELRPTEENLIHIARRLWKGATEEECAHVIAVREAEVRSNPESAQWFDAVTPFRPDNFGKSLAASVQVASRNREEPRPGVNGHHAPLPATLAAHKSADETDAERERRGITLPPIPPPRAFS